MQVEWNKFWCRVLFKEFIRHFRKMSDEQIVADIRQSMDDLEDMVQGSGTFGSKMVGWAAGRADGPFATAARENGKKGGRPRKNPQDATNGNAGVDRKSSTSCDQFTADGDTREGADDCRNPINGAVAAHTTVSKNVSTPAISTNRRRTGGPSLSQTSSLPPVRQSEPDVMSLAYSGEFGNVRLTQEQYAQLGIKFGNQQKLNRAIDSLSCKLENNELNPANHYAELVKWASYRDDMEEKEELRASSAPHYETVSEHNARIVRESDAWIHEYCQQQKKNRKAANG